MHMYIYIYIYIYTYIYIRIYIYKRGRECVTIDRDFFKNCAFVGVSIARKEYSLNLKFS